MTMVVQGPGGINVQFPDGTDAAIVDQVMRQASGEQSAPKDAGGLDATLRGIARGVTGNFIDEGVGKLGGALSWMGGGTFAEGENRALANARGMDEAADTDHPILSTGGQIGGAIAQMALLPEAKIAQALGIAGKAGTIGAKVGQAAAGGLAYGAEAGAGAAEGGLAERAKAGLEGGLTGMVAGAAGPAVGKGLGAAGGAVGGVIARPLRVARGAANPSSEAARRVTGALTADLGDPARAVAGMEQAQKAGLPIIAADMGETTRALGRSAANTSPEGRAVLDQALAARQAGQSGRVTSVIERAAPGVNAPETRALLEKAAQRANKPAYARAYFEGERGVWSPELERLTGSPAVVAAMKAAATKGKDRAITEGFGAFNPAVKITQDGQVIFGRGKGGPTYPNLQFWDYTKRELDDAAKALDRAGRNGEASVTRDLAKQLRGELDKQVPSFAKARATAAAFFGAESASEAGAAFVRMKLGTDEMLAARNALAKMSPAERSLFAEGFATKILSDVKEVGDRSSLVGRIFNSPAARERFTIALGKGAADKMEATMRVEHLMDLTKRALQGNSTTARQLAELGIAGGVGAYSGGGDLYDPTTWISAAMAYGILHGGKTALARIDTNVSREVAKLLASNDPKVVKQAIERIGKSPRLLHALRTGEIHFSRVLVPLAPNGGSVPAAVADEHQ